MEREFLKGLNLDRETVDAIMAEHGKSIEGLRENNETLSSQLKKSNERVTELETKVATFDALEKEKTTLTSERDALSAELKTVKEEFGKSIIFNAVEKEAINAGAINSADVVSFVNIDSITTDDDGNLTGVEDAVKSVKESKPYLFGEERRKAGGIDHDDGNLSLEDENKYRKSMGLPLKKT